MLLQWITLVVSIQIASSNLRPLSFTGPSMVALTETNKGFISDNNDCDCHANNCDCCFTIHTTMPPTKICAKTTFGGVSKVDLRVNGQTHYSKSITEFVDNSSPLCIPAIPGVEVCVKIYGVQLNGLSNNRICLQISARVLGNDLIGYDFQCIRYDNGIVSLGSQNDGVRFAGSIMSQPSDLHNERERFNP